MRHAMTLRFDVHLALNSHCVLEIAASELTHGPQHRARTVAADHT